MLVQLVTVHGPAQRRVLRDLVADDQQLDVLELAAAHHVKGLDEPLEVLVRLDVAGVQNERLGELIPLLHPHHFIGRRLLVEPLVDGVVDDSHLRLGYTEVLEDVPFRRFRDGQHTRRPVSSHPE